MRRLFSVMVCFLVVLLAGCGKKAVEDGQVRVGSLKGATSIGLAAVIDAEASGLDNSNYQFDMETQADVLVGKMVKGELDIALVPANVASILYWKTEGGVSVVDINTLGVLYAVSEDTDIKKFADLKGKTVYLTGKGTTPDIVMQILLDMTGITADVTLEYKSEAQEVIAALNADKGAVGILPQPFATAACIKNESLTTVLDLTAEWDSVAGEDGSRMVTGVTVVRNDFLEKHPEAVKQFISDHKRSAEYVVNNPGNASLSIEELGIVDNAKIAEKAIPYCNIVCITGDDMQNALSGYLQKIGEYDSSTIGGKVPEEDFYYKG